MLPDLIYKVTRFSWLRYLDEEDRESAIYSSLLQSRNKQLGAVTVTMEHRIDLNAWMDHGHCSFFHRDSDHIGSSCTSLDLPSDQNLISRLIRLQAHCIYV